MSRLDEIKDEYTQVKTGLKYSEFRMALINNSRSMNEAVVKIELHLDQISKLYASECCQASLGKAKKHLYNYWIFFEEGKTNEPEFTIKVEDPRKVYETAFDAYGPQVEDLFYTSLSYDESITNPDNIVLL